MLVMLLEIICLLVAINFILAVLLGCSLVIIWFDSMRACPYDDYD
jgi:hypothetical protein